MSTEFFNDQWRIPSNENQNKVSNYSMKFDAATGEEINCGNSSSFSFGNGTNDSPFSVSFWINKKDISGGGTTGIFQKGTDSFVEYGILFFLDKIRFRLKSQTNNRQIDIDEPGATALVAGSWSHVVVTYSGVGGTSAVNGMEMYINGNKIAVTRSIIVPSPNGYVAMNNLGSNLFIASRGGLGYTNADYTDFVVFDYALPATGTNSVATLYGGGTAVTNPMALSPVPVAYYQLGNQSVTNGANYLVPNNSLQDYVFDFNGTSDSIQIPTSSSLEITGNMTISAWIKPDSSTDTSTKIINKRDSGGTNYDFFIETGGDKLKFYDGTSNTASDITITPDAWNHVAITINSGVTNGSIFYVNGIGQATNLPTFTITSNDAPLTIGKSGQANTAFFDGEISNVSIFNSNLSASNIITLYNNGSPAADISSSSPVGWWKLNAQDTFDGTDWTIKDYAGSSDGTSVGMDSSNLVISDLQHTSGYSPYALDFGGITASLKTNTIPAKINVVTLSAWVKRTGTSGTTAGVFGVRNSGGSPGFGLCWDLCFFSSTNKIELRIGESDNTAYIQVSSNIALADNTWFHVVGVADGTNAYLYINGVRQTDVEPYNGDLRAPTTNIQFAAQATGGSQPFNGQLSNCARWNIGLTQAEVTEIYNQGVPSNLNTFSGTAPIGWWQLGSNSSFQSNAWTCLDEINIDNADSASGTNMTNDDIVNGPGYSANGLGDSTIDIIGDAPYSAANGLSENMDVLDRTKSVPG